MDKKKKLILYAALLSLLSFLGVSYAYFNYEKISTKSHAFLMGDISLTFNEEADSLSLMNSFPMSDSIARTKSDNFITFSLSGKNESPKDMYYEIILNHGNDIANKNRILDKFLKFDLEETLEDNTTNRVLSAVSFEEINETKIYVNTIDSSTGSQISRTYKIRMWISEDLIISSLMFMFKEN